MNKIRFLIVYKSDLPPSGFSGNTVEMENTIGQEASDDSAEIQGHPKAGQANRQLSLCVKVCKRSSVHEKITVGRTDKTCIKPGQV